MKTLLLFLSALAASAQIYSYSAVLVWQDLVNPPSTTYNVYRAPKLCSDPAPLVFEKRNTAPVAAKTYTDPALPVGEYCYRLTAVANGQESQPSTPSSTAVYEQPAPSAPSPPKIGVTVIITQTP